MSNDSALAATKVESMYHSRVPVDHHIGVVGDYDQLSPQFVFANLSYDQIVN